MKGCTYFVNTATLSTFVLTEPEMHSKRTALWLAFKKNVYTQDNTPPMPLSDAHLGGLFFLGL
jgi:hypothetical protein